MVVARQPAIASRHRRGRVAWKISRVRSLSRQARTTVSHASLFSPPSPLPLHGRLHERPADLTACLTFHRLALGRMQIHPKSPQKSFHSPPSRRSSTRSGTSPTPPKKPCVPHLALVSPPSSWPPMTDDNGGLVDPRLMRLPFQDGRRAVVRPSYATDSDPHTSRSHQRKMKGHDTVGCERRSKESRGGTVDDARLVKGGGMSKAKSKQKQGKGRGWGGGGGAARRPQRNASR